MQRPATDLDTYRKIDVETASQGKLIVMLFNGAIQRAEEAKRQLEKGKWEVVHNNLISAQDILAELRTALNMKAGTLARDLDRVYEYCQHLLIKANIRKEVGPIQECITHLIGFRDAWHELFENIAKEGPAQAPKINQHGSSIMDVQG